MQRLSLLSRLRAMRHWKFTDESDIDINQVLAYVNEAIINQNNDRVLHPTKKSTKHVETPALLKEALNKNAKLKTAYQNFSEYKRKEFNEYISTAKQEKTKLKRLEKILPMIEDGTGLNDKYR